MSEESEITHKVVDSCLVLRCQFRANLVPVGVVTPVLADKFRDLLLLVGRHVAPSKSVNEVFGVRSLIHTELSYVCPGNCCS